MIDQDQADYTQADLKRSGRTWLEKIRQSEKRDDAWIKAAEVAETAYLADEEAENGEVPRFNILHSNVETIVPSIYNSTPRPDIRPRHNNKDDIAKMGADVLERGTTTQIDDSALDEEIEANAQDAFMAGRGVVRVRFDADEVPPQIAQQFAGVDESGEPIIQEVEVSPASITNERILYECVSWRDYREGPAKRWKDVPWVAYRHEISETERERLEDDVIAEKYETEDNVDETKDCTVWEIWCKETMKVYFITEEGQKVLNISDDPLGLKGFFPQAKPVQPITATGKRCPVCPYTIYKNLAEELDRASKRINAIMRGLKVRGGIAADAEAVELISQADDNELVPIPNIENITAAGGLEKAIMWWPIETAIMVLRELYAQREQTKQAIYEVTGISDIIRGQGAASETATAQQIKTEWGSLRVKKMQNLIARQVRDLFVITSELMCKHFTAQGLQQASGMQITPEVMQLLKSPSRHYRIDVESDSTIRADATKNREQMAQFLQGTAQFFQTMGPLLAQAPQAAGPVVDMYSAFARQFDLGKSAEDALEQMVELAKQAGQQDRPNPEMEKMKAEFEMKAKEFQHQVQMDQEEQQRKTAEFQKDMQLKGADLQLKAAELKLKGEQLNLEESKAESEAAARFAEYELEDEQQRAVKLGGS